MPRYKEGLYRNSVTQCRGAFEFFWASRDVANIVDGNYGMAAEQKGQEVRNSDTEKLFFRRTSRTN